jgi:uncharacterized membrane protein YvlD (DUF360 family)
MARFLASIVLHLLANAVGLVLAATLLDDFSVTAAAFVFAVLVFTVVEIVLDPLMVKISLKYAPALRGGVALVTTFFGLLVTSILFDGLSISGATAWVVGTLIVWLGAVIAAVVLPLFLFKQAMGSRRDAGR